MNREKSLTRKLTILIKLSIKIQKTT